MNLLRYCLKRRALFGGITRAINNRLRQWAPAQTARVFFTDTERGEQYTLLVHTGRDWALFVHDLADRVVLRVYWNDSGVREVGGIRYGGTGRTIYVDTVPNSHSLAMIDKLIAQLQD